MAELGSVFEEAPGGTRGPDLRAEVEVSARALGEPDGVAVSLPATLSSPDGPLPWTRREGDATDGVRVHLPPQFPSGGVLRLRGQGGRRPEDDAPGDLWLTVRVTASASSNASSDASSDVSSDLVNLLWLALLGGGGAALAWLLGT